MTDQSRSIHLVENRLALTEELSEGQSGSFEIIGSDLPLETSVVLGYEG